MSVDLHSLQNQGEVVQQRHKLPPPTAAHMVCLDVIRKEKKEKAESSLLGVTAGPGTGWTEQPGLDVTHSLVFLPHS